MGTVEAVQRDIPDWVLHLHLTWLLFHQRPDGPTWPDYAKARGVRFDDDPGGMAFRLADEQPAGPVSVQP